MRAEGLQGRVVQVTRRQPGLKVFHSQGENLRLTEKLPAKINQHWAGDVTYIRTRRGWCYLAVVMDLYSRRIIGWSLSRSRKVELTLRALKQALKRREGQTPLIFHSDRGVEYTSQPYREYLMKRGVQPSVNRAGKCTDNGHVESFFHSLKAELIRGRRYDGERELRNSLRSYINDFYNHRRLHSGIGYLSPAEYERQVA